jgi:hypothetical protein
MQPVKNLIDQLGFIPRAFWNRSDSVLHGSRSASHIGLRALGLSFASDKLVGMANKTAQSPHPKTIWMWVIGVAVAIFIGVIGYFKASGQTSTTFNGPVSVGPGGAGINNGTIINQAPAPELKFVGERKVENKPYLTVMVVSPYPPGQLILTLEGDGVIGADINPLDAGTVQFGHREEPNKVTLYIDRPTGRYEVPSRSW